MLVRDEFRCQVCGIVYPAPDPYTGEVLHGPRGVLTLGHIVPYSKGGPSTPENLQAECAICNFTKGPQ